MGSGFRISATTPKKNKSCLNYVFLLLISSVEMFNPWRTLTDISANANTSFQWIHRSLILRLHQVGRYTSCCHCFPMSAGLSCWQFLVCIEIGLYHTGKLVSMTGMHLCVQLLKRLGLFLSECLLLHCSGLLPWCSGSQGFFQQRFEIPVRGGLYRSSL